MTLKKRIVVTLLWDGIQVVKPIQFKRPYRKLGPLMQYVNILEKRNIDELILLDIEATAQKRKPKFEELKEFTSQLFCPVTIGGGISELDDIIQLFNCGADKVSIRSKSKYLSFIEQVAYKIGNQAITVAIDITKQRDKPETLLINDIMPTWAKRIENAGAGEILLTSIDKDGTLNGYDTDLISSVCNAVCVPVIANGGCGTPAHMLEALNAGADAVAAGSMFLYTSTTPRECAKYLYEHGVDVRYE